MADDLLDRAEKMVDETIREGRIWGGRLVPSGAVGRDRGSFQFIVDRAQRASVGARVRFNHLSRRVEHISRSGVWISGGPTVDEEERVVRHDVVVEVAGLLDQDWVSHAASATEVSAWREVPGRDGERLLEDKAEQVTWTVEMSAWPVAGPHGLIRVGLRIRNTTEPLVDIDDPDLVRAHSMGGCHVVLAMDRGTFLDPSDPSGFAAGTVAGCEMDGGFLTVVGESRKVALATVEVD